MTNDDDDNNGDFAVNVVIYNLTYLFHGAGHDLKS
jgi:hypothetical protein